MRGYFVYVVLAALMLVSLEAPRIGVASVRQTDAVETANAGTDRVAGIARGERAGRASPELPERDLLEVPSVASPAPATPEPPTVAAAATGSPAAPDSSAEGGAAPVEIAARVAVPAPVVRAAVVPAPVVRAAVIPAPVAVVPPPPPPATCPSDRFCYPRVGISGTIVPYGDCTGSTDVGTAIRSLTCVSPTYLAAHAYTQFGRIAGWRAGDLVFAYGVRYVIFDAFTQPGCQAPARAIAPLSLQTSLTSANCGPILVVQGRRG